MQLECRRQILSIQIAATKAQRTSKHELRILSAFNARFAQEVPCTYAQASKLPLECKIESALRVQACVTPQQLQGNGGQQRAAEALGRRPAVTTVTAHQLPYCCL